MAITEENRLKREDETKTSQVQWNKDVIKASARYERLMASKDFTDMLHDLENLKIIHEAEIKVLASQLEGQSYFKSIRTLEIIKTHQIRVNQIAEGLAYIPKLIDAANEAREYLRLNQEETSHATRN